MAELPTQHDFEDYRAWTGRDVLSPDGERLGAVELIFLDEATDRPEWVLVRLDDGAGAAFVPLAGATVEERSIRVEQPRDRVAAAPQLDADQTLSVDQERRLYEHYGLAYSKDESATVLPEGAGASADSTPQPTEERPRMRRFAPREDAADGQATEERPAATPTPSSAEAPKTTGTGVSEPRSSASAPPTPIPPPAPHVVPPEGGFQGEERGDTDSGGPLGLLKRRPALPVALAGAIAGLIAVLALRRRR